MRIIRAYHRFPDSGRVLLDIHNWDVPNSGVYTLMAASGSGKSTLFRLLAGWFPSTGDSALVAEPDLNSTKNVRFVGTHSNLLPWLTVDQNSALQSRRTNGNLASLDEVGIRNDVGAMFPYQLSLGMSKRVELLIAATGNPKVLLLDEVFESVDDAQKQILRDFLLRRCTRTTTLVITHEPSVADLLGGNRFTFVCSNGIVRGIEKV